MKNNKTNKDIYKKEQETKINIDENKKEFTIFIIGDECVGKTCFCTRLVDNYFQGNISKTGMTNYYQKNIKLYGNNIKCNIWDCPGDRRYFLKPFVKKADRIIFLYDIIKKSSFDNLEYWIDIIREQKSDDIVIFLAGNKEDLFEDQIIEKEQGQKFANEHGFMFAECSASSNSNILFIFEKLANTIYENNQKEKQPQLYEEKSTKRI